jgi:hypothetical protein
VNKTFVLRPIFLWFSGILVAAIGVTIHARVAWLFRHDDFVAKHAIACNLDVALSRHSRQSTKETTFVPAMTREFTFGFFLRTPIPESTDKHRQIDDVFSSNPIEKALETETFEVIWLLYEEERIIASGMITEKDLSEKDLSEKVKTLDIRYVFAKRNVSLRKGNVYKLAAVITKPSENLGVFSPSFCIRTWSGLKGHLLIGWTVKETLLCSSLGSVLIVFGLLKKRSAISHQKQD